jgi:glycosyltransferase involved in cell wall biosynthesis
MINKKLLRYSPYNGGDDTEQECNIKLRSEEWLGSAKERLNKEIAYSCDAIVACCYEYWLPYKQSKESDNNGRMLNEKLFFVPLPIVLPPEVCESKGEKKLRVFVGINSIRATFKGADIMIKAAEDLAAKYPERMTLNKVENVPFAIYKEIMASSDVVIDQIYSYSPGMNALLAMSEGKVVVSGGEPECYELLGEHKCRPVVNVQPTYDSVYSQLEYLVLHHELVDDIKRQSREFVCRNHNYITVAQRMVEIYEQCLLL